MKRRAAWMGAACVLAAGLAATAVAGSQEQPQGDRGGRGQRGAPMGAPGGAPTGAPAGAPTAANVAGQPAAGAGQGDHPVRVEEDKPPVVSHHEMTLRGEKLKYTATTGMLPIRSEQTGVVEGNIFYVAYTKDGANPATRPLTFAFNGGPGSSTVWLHMGAYGPVRVHLLPNGAAPPPPYRYEENPYTLLDQTDLVFIDPVGTGYSRATKPEYGPKFWGLDEDVHAVGEFIRLYLVRNDRFGSPKFLSGESYGTTRAAHLAGWLVDNGIALNGIALLSTVLNFQMLSQSKGNDIAYVGFLPTYTATAWFYNKLPADLQSQSVDDVVRLATHWADHDYLVALNQGSRLSGEDRKKIVDQMARLTGLTRDVIEQNDLRVPLYRFDSELLRDRKQVISRFDGRFSAYAADSGGRGGGVDMTEAMLRDAFTAVLNDYLRRDLNYKSEEVYYILGGGITGRWNYGQSGQGYADVTPSLESAFVRNPAMKLYVAEGYYDGATPYWSVEYTLAHLNVAPDVRKNIRSDTFAAGHMMYIDDSSMQKLRQDLREFFDSAAR